MKIRGMQIIERRALNSDGDHNQVAKLSDYATPTERRRISFESLLKAKVNNNIFYIVVAFTNDDIARNQRQTFISEHSRNAK